MSSYGETAHRRVYRDADRAVLGGVCAGLARHFGLNLKVTRFLAVIAFLTAMPFAIIAYLAAVLLIPSESSGDSRGVAERRCCWGMRRSRRRDRGGKESGNTGNDRAVKPTVKDVRDRYRVMDKRLAELEKRVTSPRFQLEQEFRKL